MRTGQRMAINLVILAIALWLLIKGGDLFVGAGVRLAELLRVPRLVIGFTLVSFATTTPELSVSIISGFTGASHVAFGNAVGSCICNIALILGLAATCRQIDLEWRHLRVPLLAMSAFGLLLMGLYLDLRLSSWEGWALVLVGATYFALDLRRHVRAPAPAALPETRDSEQVVAPPIASESGKAAAFARFLLGAALVIGGSRMLVHSAVALAAALGIPDILIGLTIVAVGTSLPELITAIASTRKRVADLSVGNILGANIANQTYVIGSAAGISAIEIGSRDLILNFSAMLGLFALLGWFVHSDRQLSRREGWVLLAFYIVYVIVLFSGGNATS